MDLHGVVIEELELTGKKKLSKIFSLIEGRIYRKLDYVVSVTDQLSNYYKRKYPNVKAKYFKYAILPNNLNTISQNEIVNNSNGEKVKIIYSGNLQKWQNVDLMLTVIKENLFYNFEYTILTGDKNGMIDLLRKHGLDDNEQIKVASVHPSELQDYYQVAHYGFVLRDDIIVNNVACPTKIIEYMCYGIIPIVLSDNIGDFKDLGYDRIDYKQINKELKPKKSIVNMGIIDKLKQTNVFNLPLFDAV
ncbi:hypothetical protein QWZ06_05080 [Chryseobacterium tructae]|uniref:hypothetical protein n=1 Tax=Chryseobacterium tructae TaxID=1037380 RepID=UPI0025B496A1|nr:hypothetical protein [Chryseobacterium tructae]MDN3691666.1 hypothetical protein [Chryseobacterium tructae]